MKRFMLAVGGAALLTAIAAPAAAQNEDALRAFFEGRQVVVQIDMPGTSDGVDLKADARGAIDYPALRRSHQAVRRRHPHRRGGHGHARQGEERSHRISAERRRLRHLRRRHEHRRVHPVRREERAREGAREGDQGRDAIRAASARCRTSSTISGPGVSARTAVSTRNARGSKSRSASASPTSGCTAAPASTSATRTPSPPASGRTT